MNRLDRIMISSLCLSMISGQTLCVCPEGKPVSTFPDHAVESRQNAPSQHDRRVERRIRPDAVAERGPAIALRERNRALERDDSSSNRHPALSFCLSMISGQTLRVCPEGKPVPTHRVVARGHAFPDHALKIAECPGGTSVRVTRFIGMRMKHSLFLSCAIIAASGL